MTNCMSKNQIGLIGLAVMGKNLVLNLQRNGFSVSIYNRNVEKTKKFLNEINYLEITTSRWNKAITCFGKSNS